MIRAMIGVKLVSVSSLSSLLFVKAPSQFDFRFYYFSCVLRQHAHVGLQENVLISCIFFIFHFFFLLIQRTWDFETMKFAHGACAIR